MAQMGIMKLAELKPQLAQNPDLPVRFNLGNGESIPAHAHVTEVARIRQAVRRLRRHIPQPIAVPIANLGFGRLRSSAESWCVAEDSRKGKQVSFKRRTSRWMWSMNWNTSRSFQFPLRGRTMVKWLSNFPRDIQMPG